MRKEYFEEVSPEETGIKKELLEKIEKTMIEENNLEIHSFLVIKDSKLIYEKYFRENEKETPHIMYSVSKSFTSIAIGIAQDEGLLDINDSIIEYFPEYAELEDIEEKKKMKIKHVLMMSTGIHVDEGKLWDRIDFVDAFFKLKMDYEPGTQFEYSTVATYMLSALITRITSMTLHDFVKEKIFAPLGIEDTYWQSCLKGISIGGSGLYITSYDMAKFGQLLLNKGLWNDKQIVSEEFIKQATSKQIENGSPDDSRKSWTSGYGFKFWINEFGGFRADGMKGQYIVVFPEKSMVFVITSDINDMQLPLKAIGECLENIL